MINEDDIKRELNDIVKLLETLATGVKLLLSDKFDSFSDDNPENLRLGKMNEKINEPKRYIQ